MTFSDRAIEAAKAIDFAKESRDLKQALADNVYPAADGSADIDNHAIPIIEATLRNVAERFLTAALAVDGLALQGWRTIDSAPKDRTPILAKFFDDIYPRIRPARDDLERWNGLQVVLRHPGLADNGFDIGWSVAAPVGNGGFPDEWIEGWMPLPLTAASDGEVG